jgi:hypothetical protein
MERYVIYSSNLLVDTIRILLLAVGKQLCISIVLELVEVWKWIHLPE